MCAEIPRSAFRLILARGCSGPVASPGQGRQPLDPTRDASPPRPRTRSDFISPLTLDQRSLHAPLDSLTRGSFRASLMDTHRPGVCRHGPHQGVCTPPWTPRQFAVQECRQSSFSIRFGPFETLSPDRTSIAGVNLRLTTFGYSGNRGALCREDAGAAKPASEPSP